MAQTLGLGLTAWSPIGGGLLTGKYRRSADGLAGPGRMAAGGGAERPVSERDWRVVEELEKVAAELGRSMAQVAVNWVATQPAVGSVIIGASSAAQLDSNLGALDFEIPADARAPARRGERADVRPAVPDVHARSTSPGSSAPGLGIGDKPAGYAPPVWNAAA